MLYNKDWDNPINQVSLADFIAWLETKNPDETYNYCDKCGQCCVGQYMAARQIPWPEEWSGIYRDVCNRIFGSWSSDVVYLVLGNFRGWTTTERICKFSDALERAKAFQETQKVKENA